MTPTEPSTPLLNALGLYAVAHVERLLLYAPLASVTAETDADELQACEYAAQGGNLPDQLRELVGAHPRRPGSPDDIDAISILINQKCNFTCRYCYSAGGRSKAELPDELFGPLTEWFVSRRRLEASGAKELSVTFSGGGDPTLSMPKLRRLVGMLRTKSAAEGVPLRIGLVCNGSLLAEPDIDFIAANIDDMVISFDVLEDVHNAQRSHYAVVADTIRALCARGIDIGLRSTVTALNVGRLTEMVEELHHSFPACRRLAAEAVLAPDMWPTAEALGEFYDTFAEEYFKARERAKELGLELGNTIELSAEGLKARACVGKVVVTPEGRLTACSRVATEGDTAFNHFVFGELTPEGVECDYDRYAEIMADNAYSHPECRSCVARWHCGGGCALARRLYTPEAMGLHCRLTRQILKKRLFNELD